VRSQPDDAAIISAQLAARSAMFASRRVTRRAGKRTVPKAVATTVDGRAQHPWIADLDANQQRLRGVAQPYRPGESKQSTDRDRHERLEDAQPN
jgi:hypothetical protein